MEDKYRLYKIGGRDLSEYMFKLLARSGQNIKYLEYAKLIKEKTCYCALDYKEEIKSVNSINYELPDSNIIVKDEGLKCAEALFNSLLDIEEDGISKVCYDILQDIFKSYNYFFFDKIFLAGGNSLIKGLPQRFENEIRRLLPYKSRQEKELKITASSERIYNTWIGGKIFSCISSFNYQLISKTEYEEYGTSIFIKKGFL
jgi:actin-related protein